MRRFILAQLRSSAARLIAAGLAVILGTAFVTATLLVNDLFRVSIRTTVAADLHGATARANVDQDRPYGLSDDQLDTIRRHPGVVGVEPLATADLFTGHGGGTGGDYVLAGPVTTYGKLPKILAGASPTRPNEVIVREDLAESLSAEVGKTIEFRTPKIRKIEAAEGAEDVIVDWEPITVKVTGIYRQLSLTSDAPRAYATFDQILEWKKSAEEHDEGIREALIYTSAETDANQLSSELTNEADGAYRVLSAQQVIDDRVKESTGIASFFVLFGLAFAAVAVFVAAMVIANTFDVLVAQRTKLLAQLRCSGATRTQIHHSVLIEATLFGLISSIIGTAAGIGFGLGASWYVKSQDYGVDGIALSDVSFWAYVVPVVVGVLVTVLAALGPARSATRVSPVEALQPSTVGLGRGGGRSRLIVGAVLGVVGLVALLAPPIFYLAFSNREYSESAEALLGVLLLVAILGGLLTVGSFLILAVFIVPRVIRLLSQLAVLVLPKSSASTMRLASANAVRHPIRTATTTSAVVLGVGLVVLMGTGAATAKVTAANQVNDQFPIDVMLHSERGLSDNQIAAVKNSEGVVASTPIWRLPINDAAEKTLMVVPLAELNATLNSDPITQPPRGHILMGSKAKKELGAGAELTINLPGNVSTTFPVHEEMSQDYSPLLDSKDLPSSVKLGAPKDYGINLASAKDVQVLRQALAKADPEGDVFVSSAIEVQESITQVIDVLLAVMLGLLGVAVVISLVGVANTLSLSVIERRREHGTLRALGVIKGQVRQMLAVEGVLIALSGAVIGIALGLICGFAGSAVLLSFTNYKFEVDWLVMLGAVAIAIFAGLVASVLPSRSALRVPVVEALATE